MTSSQSFFNEYDIYVTPSDIIEFLYCKRFVYYMKCLGIRQYEEKRYKVQKGREVHTKRVEQNKDYLRKRIGAVEKHIDLFLQSREFGIRGKVDEVVLLSDGTMAPLDYKFAIYDERIFKTYKTQLMMYGLMIEEVFKKPVRKGFICYCRKGFTVKEIEMDESTRDSVVAIIKEYKEVLKGYYPTATRNKSKCLDCCYRNICIKK